MTSIWHVQVVWDLCLGLLGKVSWRRRPHIKCSLADSLSLILLVEDVCMSRIRTRLVYSVLSWFFSEETHINYIAGSNSVPIIPLLLADVVCEPARTCATATTVTSNLSKLSKLSNWNASHSSHSQNLIPSVQEATGVWSDWIRNARSSLFSMVTCCWAMYFGWSFGLFEGFWRVVSQQQHSYCACTTMDTQHM